MTKIGDEFIIEIDSVMTNKKGTFICNDTETNMVKRNC